MHILSNGPHLVSPQEAQKVTKTQNEVTVEPYFWSLIDCHPVSTTQTLKTFFFNVLLELGGLPHARPLAVHLE